MGRDPRLAEAGGLETVPCNLCGSSSWVLAYSRPDELYHPEEWFDVVACRDCGLGFVNPRPTPAAMGRYYPSNFYDGFESDQNYHENRYAIEASFVERFATRPTRRLLDIGCANGGFPRFMKGRGWAVEGVEVSLSSRPVRDFRVHAQPFPEIAIDSPSFDALTAWAVLEHVHDPMAHFRKASSVLEHGGVFVFLVTNFESIASRHLFGEDVPRHLYFFTEGCVRRYLAENGFELLDVDYSDRVYPMLPVGWLRRRVSESILGRRFEYADSRVRHDRWLRDRGLRRTPLNLARFAVQHPVAVIDRALAPLRAKWEMAHRSYGIVTYTARKKSR